MEVGGYFLVRCSSEWSRKKANVTRVPQTLQAGSFHHDFFPCWNFQLFKSATCAHPNEAYLNFTTNITAHCSSWRELQVRITPTLWVGTYGHCVFLGVPDRTTPLAASEVLPHLFGSWPFRCVPTPCGTTALPIRAIPSRTSCRSLLFPPG